MLKSTNIQNENINVINIDKLNIDLSNESEQNIILNVPENEDVAAMLYTSGTTGNPKGVMLTYDNLNKEIDGLLEKKLLNENSQTLALLPFHHILPLTATILVVLRTGASLVFVEKIASKEIMEVLARNRVTTLVGVPRLYKLFYDGIKNQIESKVITRKVYEAMKNIKSVKLRKIIFKKVHKKFGGHLTDMVCGGAKLDPEIGDFFETLGFHMLEGYGLTETSPVISVNSVKERKIGTVGKAMFNTELKIVDEELWVKGPQVMKGYYNNKEKTDEVITEDGWFKTGDLAEIDSEGFVTIKGRKNSMIVLSNGKNIDPESVENKILSIGKTLIKEIGVLGLNDKLSAIIVPNLIELKKAGINNIQVYIKDIIEDYNLEAANYKKILDYKLIDDELPKTKLGKLRRFMLKDLYVSNEKIKKEVEQEPNTNEYKALKEYFISLKGIEVLPDDNLELELGLDSLDKVELIAYIESTFGVKIDEESFSDLQTLKLLSDFVSEKSEFFENNETNWKNIIDSAKDHKIKNGWITNSLRPLIYIFVKMYFRLKINRNAGFSDKPHIMISNHQSFIDSFVLGALMTSKIQRNTFFLAINWYFKKGLLKMISDNGNIILVDIDKNIKETVEEISVHIKNGKNVLIFPEGSRTKDGKVAKFKKVFAIIAKELDVEIQCLGIKGGYEAYSRFMKFPRPKKIEVTVLERYKPEGTYEEIRLKAENIIRNYVENKFN